MKKFAKVVEHYGTQDLLTDAEVLHNAADGKPSQFTEFVKDGKIFHISYNRIGNINRVTLWGSTPERACSEIGEYHDEERGCNSDAGLIVINGLGISNGYGDGHNSIIVRKFTKRPVLGAAYCRAQIYNKDSVKVLYPRTATVRIEAYDCAPVGQGEPAYEGPATCIVICNRKVWVILDETNKA